MRAAYGAEAEETGGPCGDRLFACMQFGKEQKRGIGRIEQSKRIEKKTSGRKEEDLLDSSGYPW